MNNSSIKLIVFFESPFWIGVFEQIENKKLSVCKITFGVEPKDYEVLDFVMKNYFNLKFSSSVDVIIKKESINPKRLQKQAMKQTTSIGIGTKSQQALQMQREQLKIERKLKNKHKKQAEEKRKYELKQQKRKNKHKGK